MTNSISNYVEDIRLSTNFLHIDSLLSYLFQRHAIAMFVIGMILEKLGHIPNWIIFIPFYLNAPWENWAPKSSSWVCLDKEHSCFPAAKRTVRKGTLCLLYFQEELSTARVGFLMAVIWQGNSMGQAYS